MHIKTITLLREKEVFVSFTDKPVTPWGGLVLFSGFAREIGLAGALRQHMPFAVTSPNATPPEDIALAFMSGVIIGARRFSHLEHLRQDCALGHILGLERFVADATFSRFFGRFRQGEVNALFGQLFRWQLAKLPSLFPVLKQGCTLNLDSSVFERYGHQEGAVLGYNPKKHRRPSHHPLFATLGEIPIVVHSWLRSGNTSSHRGAAEFLAETLALLPADMPVTAVRGDSGFGVDHFLAFLEGRLLKYAVAGKFTRGLQNKIAGINDWERVDDGITIAEVMFQAQGWPCARRVVVVRERTPKKDFVRGRELFDNPAYAYQAVITNMPDDAVAVWRFQRGRADIENRLRELKWDYGMDGFCLKKFFATEAALRLVCLTHNLVAMLERRLGHAAHATLGTLRMRLFACGAILGKTARKTALRLSLKGHLQERFRIWLESLYSGNGNCVAVGTG